MKFQVTGTFADLVWSDIYPAVAQGAGRKEDMTWLCDGDRPGDHIEVVCEASFPCLPRFRRDHGEVRSLDEAFVWNPCASIETRNLAMDGRMRGTMTRDEGSRALARGGHGRCRCRRKGHSCVGIGKAFREFSDPAARVLRDRIWIAVPCNAINRKCRCHKGHFGRVC